MRKLVVCVVAVCFGTLSYLPYANMISACGYTMFISRRVCCNTNAQYWERQSSIRDSDHVSHRKLQVCTLMAGWLLYILFKARSQTQNKSAATILTRLLSVTVHTGFATAVAAGLQLVAHILSLVAANQYRLMFSLFIGKVYANVLLATLNARTVRPVLLIMR
ncbi:hypothetical protein PLICRDRAFT_435072 [Plicaturopsis crispa FD-325 SS-3]|uniref:DUF6534 domain-containing protein n=1 Tax=Plicaturopsis crispa FD-325 SS-3 TaxID=944288 RepID=A0A0C9T3T2_PLICR|nr:hypothetical protein PLICRDRAFT_435072 [Plicaturopsis crispa FD-325 SS-3]